MRLISAPLFLSAILIVPATPTTETGFDNLSLRTIRFSPSHVERLPLAAIEQLRQATPLPRPLTPESLASVREDLYEVLTLTGSTISDAGIEQLQGHFGRRLWGPGYVDVTGSIHDGFSDDSQARFVAPIPVPDYPKPDPSAHPELKAMLKMVNSTEIRSYVAHLSTAYSTRYYRSEKAREPSVWIQSQFASWLGHNQTQLFENSFDQPNVIGRIEAKSGNASAPIVIIGAHLDSISPFAAFQAPGADDDASGMSTVMAIIRILKASKYQGSYAIEAHAYGGEEAGLLGSDAVATAYRQQGKEIRGMLQYDMVGYQPSTLTNQGKSSTITVLADPLPAMAKHMVEVVQAYVPTAEQRSVNCGYGCSDHYSFHSQGYPVVCLAAYGPNDRNLNPNLHTIADTLDKLDFDKMTDFIRAGLSWAVELAA